MIRRARPGLGTLVEIRLQGAAASDSCDPADYPCPSAPQSAPPFDPEPALQQAFEQIALVQRLMSFHDPDSDLSRLNRAPVGSDIRVDPHTYTVLQMAEQLRHESDGLFDIGWGANLVASGYLPAPLVAVAAAAPSPPHPARLAPRLPLLSFGRDGMVRKHQPGLLDLGGIAKGYAVDLALSCLQRHGIKAALVNAGGDMRGYGAHGWPVAVRDPANPLAAGGHPKLGELRDAALATSARYFDQRHLLNGQTGQVVAASYSVTVQAPTCMLADALCKVVYASANPDHPALARHHASALLLAA